LYRVKEFSWGDASDRELEDAKRWVRAGINQRYPKPGTLGVAVVFADGTVVRGYAQYDPDLAEFKLSLANRGQSEFFIEEGENGELILRRDVDGIELVIRLLRDTEAEFELTRRGFHWINEYPRNR
jgi:hypothetical protein